MNSEICKIKYSAYYFDIFLEMLERQYELRVFFLLSVTKIFVYACRKDVVDLKTLTHAFTHLGISLNSSLTILCIVHRHTYAPGTPKKHPPISSLTRAYPISKENLSEHSPKLCASMYEYMLSMNIVR